MLLAAPQNFSADLLASALAAAGVEPVDLLRLNDPRRPIFQARLLQWNPLCSGAYAGSVVGVYSAVLLVGVEPADLLHLKISRRLICQALPCSDVLRTS